jgi:uncharacterized membrane protein
VNFFIKAIIVIAVAVAMGLLTMALVQPPGSRGTEPVAVYASLGVSLLSLAFLAGLFFLRPPAVNSVLCPGLLASGTFVIVATLPTHVEPPGLRALAVLAGVMLLAVGVWAGVAPAAGDTPPPASQP